MTDVALLPGTTNEMLEAEYWLNRIADTDRVLMNENMILQFNHKNVKEAGEQMKRYNLLEFGESIDREDLVSMISAMDLPDETLYCGGRELEDSIRIEISDNRNLSGVPFNTPVRYGVCTRRSSIRMFPSYRNINEAPDDIDTDILQCSAILINEPVLVLLESSDRHFLFIRCSYYDGWVSTEAIAFCKERSMWIDLFYTPYKTMDDFIVVTANRICLPYHQEQPDISLLELTMGIRFAIDRSVKNIWNNYVVRIPVRSQNGDLKMESASIPVSSGIHRGYISYTTSNVLKLAFQTLGETYGWGGSADTRDCSSLAMELYRCFGFQLPRDSWSFAYLRGCVSYTDFRDMTIKDREDLFRKLRPGAIIGWPGHTMLYIGHVEERFYVINYVGHFSVRKQGAVPKRLKVNMCMVNDLNVERDNGLTWLETLQYVKSIE